jgi:hypothetical protein
MLLPLLLHLLPLLFAPAGLRDLIMRNTNITEVRQQQQQRQQST